MKTIMGCFAAALTALSAWGLCFPSRFVGSVVVQASVIGVFAVVAWIMFWLMMTDPD